ncbi:MAG TPA: hypothetical protein VM783_18045 [Candidatus Acidoferrum sp.]|nr:hypothetical protein [Candidatus Acidoferrum sp.]
MTIASGTATTAEIQTLYNAVLTLESMLREFDDGRALGGATPKVGRFTAAQLDTQISAVSAAITAVNA